MHILYTDLYTFTMVFTWRICPPIQSFSGGGLLAVVLTELTMLFAGFE